MSTTSALADNVPTMSLLAPLPRLPAAQQRAVGAPLHELEGKVANAGLKSPTLLVIGPVCALSPHYESLVREDVVEGQIVPRPRSAWTSGGESKVETGSVGEV